MKSLPKNSLTSRANPYRHKTYVISIKQEIPLKDEIFMFGLRFVPDKLLLDHDSLSDYLKGVLLDRKESTEILAHDILEEITNQIIPKWIEVNLRQEPNSSGQDILVTVEDRQPSWENNELLLRLGSLF